ncbi:MMPL family transporter [Methylosoma difficile]
MTQHKPTFLDAFFNQCERQIIHFPWVLLLASFLACGAVAYYVYDHLGINTNTAEMLSPDLTFQKNQKRIDQAFPQDAATILLIIEGITPEETTIAAGQLIDKLGKQTDRFDSVISGTDNAFFRQQALLYLDEADLEALAKKLTDAQPFIGHLAQNYHLDGLFEIIRLALEKRDESLPMELKPLLLAIDNTLKHQLDGQPQRLSWQNLLADDKLNADAKRSLVIAKPKLNFSELLPADAAQSATREAVRAVMADNPGVKIRITGETALEHEELESVTVGAEMAGLASLVLVFLVQWVGLRSLKLLLITYIVLVMGLVFTAGFAAITVGHLNVISIAFATLYIGLGVDYAVHICLYYRERRARGYSNAQAVHHSMKGVGSSLFMCALTTSIGFLAFIPTDYAGVSELGIISGGGIFIGLLISVTVLPALFCVWPVNDPKPIATAFWPSFLITLPFRHAKLIKITSILLGIGACVALTQLKFDSNPINLRDPHSESVMAFKELVKSKNDSPFALTALANNLDDAEKLAAKMKQLPTVHETITLASFVAKDQDEKLLTLEDLNLILGNQLQNFSNKLPENSNPKAALEKFNAALKKAIAENSPNAPKDTLEQLQQRIDAFIKMADSSAQPDVAYRSLEKNLLDLLPFTLERLKTSLNATAFGIDDIPADVRSHWLSSNGLYKILITPKEDINDDANLKRFVADVQAIDNTVSGLPVANLASGEAVVKAFLQAFGGAFVAIVLVLLVIYRSIRQTALVVLPLVLAALLTGASNVLLNNDFNFANIIALPLLLGLGIDSSILIMHRLHFNLSENENLLQSSTTRGIIFSSITTLCSFSSLSFTAHQGMASMGLLLSLGLFFTVICSLIVLPAFSGKRV